MGLLVYTTGEMRVSRKGSKEKRPRVSVVFALCNRTVPQRDKTVRADSRPWTALGFIHIPGYSPPRGCAYHGDESLHTSSKWLFIYI